MHKMSPSAPGSNLFQVATIPPSSPPKKIRVRGITVSPGNTISRLRAMQTTVTTVLLICQVKNSPSLEIPTIPIKNPASVCQTEWIFQFLGRLLNPWIQITMTRSQSPV